MAKKRTLTSEEERLWHSITKGVAPMQEAGFASSPHPSLRPPFAKPHKQAASQFGVHTPAGPKPSRVPRPTIRHLPSLPPSTSQTVSSSQSLSNLDRKEKQRVRRGTVEVDAKIDLHGMRQGQAHQALIHRVSEARLDGRRVLLVVTGKGGSKARARDSDAPFWSEGGGVLRQQVPVWLGQDPLRSMVFSVQQAHQRHGGGGALYVFLKKIR